MTIRTTGIRLFVSSTFRDFQRERAILASDVFPDIAHYCSDRGFQFQPIDLRWGIAESEAAQQRTLQICLNEVARCTQTSLRPYFLVLLGTRYGWRPLPSAIEKDEFDRLLRYLARGKTAATGSGRTARMLKHWYRLDRNHVPAQYVLRARRRGESGATNWSAVERRLRTALEQAARAMRLGPSAMEKYTLSATAQEIARGVLSPEARALQPELEQHVLCFLRRRLGLPPSRALDLDGSYFDLLPDGSLDKDAFVRQAELEERVRASLGENVLVYQDFPSAPGGSATYEDAFKTDARRVLGALVRTEIERLNAFAAEEAEWAQHDEFAMDRAALVSGREDLIDAMDRFLDRATGRGMVVHGMGGMGKSTLVAKTAQMASSERHGMVVLQRYIGTTASATRGQSIVMSLIRQLSAATSVTADASTDMATLARTLRRLLAQAAFAAPRGILLAIDAVDQLDADDPALNLDWLPWPVPERMALIVSVKDGPRLAGVKRRMAGADTVHIGGLEPSAGRDVLRSLLRESDRRLGTVQERHVLRAFAVEGSPLFLRIAARMAVRWPSFSGEKPFVGRLERTTRGLIRQYFDQLSTDQGHNPVLVNKAFGLLIASGKGLTEPELLALIWKDDRLQGSIADPGRGHDVPAALPMIFWSRLRDDLGGFLVERNVDGVPVLAFFHALFGEVAKESLLRSKGVERGLHRALADYFDAQPLRLKQISGSKPVFNQRKLSQLAYQLIRSRQGDRLADLLGDKAYFQAKLAAGRAEELYGEFFACGELIGVERGTKPRQLLSEMLVRQIVTVIEDRTKRSQFSIEQVHASFVYRSSPLFYRHFLESAIRRLRSHGATDQRFVQAELARFELRLANLHRRDGDARAAERTLDRVLPSLRRGSDGVEVSRAEYELGYLLFLRGELEAAARLFDLSAATAARAGNPVSEAISRCVAGRVRWVAAVAERRHVEQAPEFLRLLAHAETIFFEEISLDANAARWIYNVRHHRFGVAFRIGDTELAASAADCLRSDAWATQFDQLTVDLHPVEARLDVLRGNFAAGGRALIAAMNAQSPKAEGSAELCFDAGFSMHLAGQTNAALRAWAIGTSRRRDLGNAPWIDLIASARRSASVGRIGITT